MALNCRININSQGEVTSINAPNGAKSQLYENLKKILGDKAKQVYAITETEGFKNFMNRLNFSMRPTQTTPEEREKQTAKLVTEYLKSKGQNINILSEEDMLEEVRKRGYDSFEAMVESWKGINEYEVYDDRELSDTITLEFNEGSVTIGDVFELYDFLENYESEFSNPDSFFEIQDLQIKPEFQGQGKGRELLRDTIKYIQENFGNKDIYLNASPIGNRALSAQELSDFYATEGFKVLEDEGSNITMVRKGRNQDIQFLNNGEKIHGFYDTNTKEIYLTEELLSSENLVHEMYHSFKPVLEQKTDKTSKAVLKEMEKLSLELLGGEQVVENRYNKETQKDAGLNFSMQNNWFSNALKGISKIQQKSATPEQWVKMIADRGGKGTTQELDWIGLKDYLNDYLKDNNSKSIPKEVVEQYINDNQIEIVEVSKKTLKSYDYDEEIEKLEKKYENKFSKEDLEKMGIVFETLNKEQYLEKYGESGWSVNQFIDDSIVMRANIPNKLVEKLSSKVIEVDFGTMEDIVKDISRELAYDESEVAELDRLNPLDQSQPKYSEYQLEGGDSYREVLLTLPNKINKEQLSDYNEAVRERNNYLAAHYDDTLNEKQESRVKKMNEKIKELIEQTTFK